MKYPYIAITTSFIEVSIVSGEVNIYLLSLFYTTWKELLSPNEITTAGFNNSGNNNSPKIYAYFIIMHGR